MDVKRLRCFLADRRDRARSVDLLGFPDGKEQFIGLFAGLSIGREERLDIPLEGNWQATEHRAAVETRERQIDEKILRTLGGDFRPGCSACRAFDEAECSSEAAKGGNYRRGLRKFIAIRQAAASR